MTLKGESVTLTLYSSPVRAIPQPSARRAVKFKNPPAVRPVHLKNPFPQPFYTTCRHQAAITLGAKPCQPSRRRRVQWRSRIGGGERSEPIRRMLIMPYDTARSSRNADFISIAAERQSATLGAKGPVKLTNPWAEGPSILRTLTPKVCPMAKPDKGEPSSG